MKQVFKCDYCSKMGTEEEIKEHEPKCLDNYDRKSCYTCVHKNINCNHNIKEDKAIWVYKCELGKEIPEGMVYEFCDTYERKANPYNLGDLFGDLFGGYKR